jgi:hypothetical protein
MNLGMVVSGIIDNDHSASSASRTGLPKMFKKRMESQGVKLLLFSLENQFSITQTDSAKIAHALAGGMVQQYRVLVLWRNPH